MVRQLLRTAGGSQEPSSVVDNEIPRGHRPHAHRICFFSEGYNQPSSRSKGRWRSPTTTEQHLLASVWCLLLIATFAALL